MKQVVLVNELGVPEADMVNMVAIAQYYADRVAEAWKLEPVTVSTTASEGAWNVYLTERLRERGSKGSHNVKDGVPFAWVSLASVLGKMYGNYTPEKAIPALVVGKVTIKPARIQPAKYADGLSTIICHELGEMMVDPMVNNWSAPDPKGRKWLIEICSNIYGSYWTETINGNLCIFHDFVLPEYYDTEWTPTISFKGSVSKPFQLTKTSYAYYVDTNGVWTKVV